MSMMCFYCSGVVYLAETKTYDGKTFHGLCFGIWKRQTDFEHNQQRHAEYYKVADACPTKIRISNYNTVIYATQYDPTGTQPNTLSATLTRASSDSFRRQDSYRGRTFPQQRGKQLHNTFTL